MKELLQYSHKIKRTNGQIMQTSYTYRVQLHCLLMPVFDTVTEIKKKCEN